jgi:hypothetical protein
MRDVTLWLAEHVFGATPPLVYTGNSGDTVGEPSVPLAVRRARRHGAEALRQGRAIRSPCR